MKQKSRYSEIKKNRKFFIGRPKLCLKEVLETKEKLKKKRKLGTSLKEERTIEEKMYG